MGGNEKRWRGRRDSREEAKCCAAWKCVTSGKEESVSRCLKVERQRLRTEDLTPLFCFQVENSENLLQVQTVLHPAEKRGSKCTHTLTSVCVCDSIRLTPCCLCPGRLCCNPSLLCCFTLECVSAFNTTNSMFVSTTNIYSPVLI